MITIYGLHGEGFAIPLEEAVGLRELRMRVWSMIPEDDRCPYWKQICLMQPQATQERSEDDRTEWTVLRTDDDVLDLEDGAELRYLVSDLRYRVSILHESAAIGHHWVALSIKRRIFRFQGIVDAVFPEQEDDRPERVHAFYFHYCPYRVAGDPVFLIGGENVDRNDNLHLLGYVLGHALDPVSETGGWVHSLTEVVEAKCVGVVRREERDELVRAWASVDVFTILLRDMTGRPGFDAHAVQQRLDHYRG